MSKISSFIKKIKLNNKKSSIKSKDDEAISTGLQSGPLTAEEYTDLSKDNGFGKARNLMGKRLENKYKEANAQLGEIRDQLKSGNISINEYNNKRNDIYSNFGNSKSLSDIKNYLQEQATQGPQIQDYAHAYAPHAIGVGLTVGLGNATVEAFNSKGQKSNADLYSNPF